jgi:hypothetical protein
MVIGYEDDLAVNLDDGARDLHLAIVEIEQRSLRIDGGGSDHRVVHLELSDEFDGCRTDNGPSTRRTGPPATITSMRGYR